LDAAAALAERLAVVGRPADRLEGRAGLFLAHARNRCQRQRPCGGREEEVLRHGFRIRQLDDEYDNSRRPVVNAKVVSYDNFLTAATSELPMTGDREWSDRAKRLMKSELKRADVTYEELARRLTEMGFRETKASIASKLSRGA